MKKDRTIKQLLVPVFLISTCIPMLLFAAIFLYRLNRTLNENIELQIENNLNQADQSLNMILDKYDTLLYDLCTDDEIIDIVNQINQDEDTLESNSSRIRRELSHICNRNEGIAGITIVTENGQILFYDRLTGSSATTAWADQIQVPEKKKTAIYRSTEGPIESDGEQVYLFQIIRNIVDYHDIHKSMGTIVFSIDESVLQTMLESGDNATIRIVSNSRILASPDPSEIGKIYDTSDTGDYRYAHRLNEKSGFMITVAHSLEMYKRTLRDQIILWILIVVGCIILLNLSSFYLFRPHIRQLELLDQAMKEVENGNLEVQIPDGSHLSTEIRQISSGFNDMVKHLDSLIARVKEAVVEQKNAEISALEAQIDPHFLYNTLDTINWKAIEEGQFEISEMVGALADILRYTVKNAGAETSIEQEMYFLEYYIFLQKAKLEKELTVEMQIPQKLYGYRIHKLLIQPFVENALKHGLRNTEQDPKLGITMREAGDQIHIIVWNNGEAIPAEELRRLNSEQMEEDPKYDSEHLGIINVRKRLALYYGDQAAVYFDSSPGMNTEVHLFIPIVRAEVQETDAKESTGPEAPEGEEGGSICGS